MFVYGAVRKSSRRMMTTLMMGAAATAVSYPQRSEQEIYMGRWVGDRLKLHILHIQKSAELPPIMPSLRRNEVHTLY